jgi:hypothetical protein
VRLTVGAVWMLSVQISATVMQYQPPFSRALALELCA